MKIDETNISVETDVSLWQYDKSSRLNAMLSMMDSILKASFTDFLNNFETFVMFIKNIGSSQDIPIDSAFSIWGMITGMKRPNVTVNGVTAPISDDLYKRILIARLQQMYTPGTLTAIEAFVSSVFGNGVNVIDNNDMTIGIVITGDLTDEESALLGSADLASIIELPIGVGFGITQIRSVGQFGLNMTENEGQNLENFALTQNSDNGGSLV